MRLLKKNLKYPFIFTLLIQNQISSLIFFINYIHRKFHEGIHFPLINKILQTSKFHENVEFIFVINIIRCIKKYNSKIHNIHI